jgi:hypothetical protein
VYTGTNPILKGKKLVAVSGKGLGGQVAELTISEENGNVQG